jgi:hypothetical protein
VTLIILTQSENGISYGFYTRGKFCAEDKLIKTMGWILGLFTPTRVGNPVNYKD